MKQPPLHPRIRPLAHEDLRALEWRLPGPTLDHHQRLFARQQVGELTAFVAWYDETSIGQLLVRWNDEGKDAENDGATARIDDVFVLPPFRRRGVGGQLVAHAEASIRARAIPAFALVPPANRAARRLFAARGFVPEGPPNRGQTVRMVKTFG